MTIARFALLAVLAAPAFDVFATEGIPPCSPEEAQTAWTAARAARSSWAALHDQYVAYADAPGCAGDALPEAWSEAVLDLLANRWTRLPELARILERDPPFLQFVLKRMHESVDLASIRRVAKSARAACPTARERLCSELRRAADAELSRSGKLRSFGGSGGLGDDVCALMLRIEATATDSDGNPLEGVELWVMHRLQPAPPVARASRYGITDARGQLSALDCYMSRNTFMFWSPEKEPLRLELLALKTGFGVERVSVSPPLDDVLAAGSLVTTKPGEWAHGDNSISEWRGRAYPVKVSVVLHGTVAR